MPSWSEAGHYELEPGRYRGVVRALPRGASTSNAEASGTALAYTLQVLGDGEARQSIRVTHRQTVWVELEVHDGLSPSRRRSLDRSDDRGIATVRFHSATDVATVGSLQLLPERAEISGVAGGRHFVLRSAPFTESLSGRERWEEAIWRGRLPAERLEGWAHALHAGAAVPYSVEVERDGNAVEEVTVPYIEEQEVVVRAFPAPLASRYDRRTDDQTLVAVKILDSADAAWPHGWEHCVGHLELEGAWSKLVCWDGAHSNVPRWLPAANPTEDEVIAEMSVARQERSRSWRQNHTTTLSRWERSDSVWDTVRDADHSRSGYYSPGRADDLCNISCTAPNSGAISPYEHGSRRGARSRSPMRGRLRRTPPTRRPSTASPSSSSSASGALPICATPAAALQRSTRRSSSRKKLRKGRHPKPHKNKHFFERWAEGLNSPGLRQRREETRARAQRRRSRRSTRLSGSDSDSDSSSDGSGSSGSESEAAPGCVPFLTSSSRPHSSRRRRRKRRGKGETRPAWERSLGIDRHGVVYHGLLAVSEPWRGYRRMEGADAGCAVALVGVGAALTLRLASLLLRGKAAGGDKP